MELADVDRADLVRRVLDDPPQVHRGAVETGVWSTDSRCYDLMATLVDGESRTLETGLGVSTALFAMWGADHTCVVQSEYEVSQMRAYLRSRNVDASRLRFEMGSSDQVMPMIADAGELDLVLIDGCHGWPNPIIDWYYGARRLRDGGVVFIDDRQLRSVSLGLVDFLDADPRWRQVAKVPKCPEVLRPAAKRVAKKLQLV
jgi:predicted O-methyltransferase YrrM